MHILAGAFGFFHWVGISHYINLLFVGFLIRSGLQILSAHPKLYWNDACRPESAWLKFTRRADAERPSSGPPRTRKSLSPRGLRFRAAKTWASGATGTSSARSSGC